MLASSVILPPSFKLTQTFLEALKPAGPWQVTVGDVVHKITELGKLPKLIESATQRRVNVSVALSPRFVAVRRKGSLASCPMPFPPSIHVMAGDYVLIWRLSRPIGEVELDRLTRSMAKQIGGEPAGISVPLPGTIRHVPFGVGMVSKMPVQMLPPSPHSYSWADGRMCRPAATVAVAASPFQAADTVTQKPIEWLWPAVIPAGALTLLGGSPGMGKSQAAISIAAHVSRGREWPGGGKGTLGSALVLEAEDDIASVVTPRLVAAGADLRRVGVGKAVDLSGGPELLEAERQRRGDLKLVVLSPVRKFIGEAEKHGNLGVRQALDPLLTWAEQHGVAVLGIAHPPKSAENKEAFAGSGAFLEIARAAYSVLADPESQEPIIKRRPRLLVSAKSNLSADDVRLSYRIEDATAGELAVSRIVWSVAAGDSD